MRILYKSAISHICSHVHSIAFVLNVCDEQTFICITTTKTFIFIFFVKSVTWNVPIIKINIIFSVSLLYTRYFYHLCNYLIHTEWTSWKCILAEKAFSSQTINTSTDSLYKFREVKWNVYSPVSCLKVFYLFHRIIKSTSDYLSYTIFPIVKFSSSNQVCYYSDFIEVCYW